MATTTIMFGLALVLIGLGVYARADGGSGAMLPACFGLAFMVAGWLARNERSRMHAMHAAVALGLVGFVLTVSSLAQLPAVWAGEVHSGRLAVVAQAAMALLTGLFVGLCVRSFVQARRARTGAGKEA